MPRHPRHHLPTPSSCSHTLCRAAVCSTAFQCSLRCCKEQPGRLEYIECYTGDDFAHVLCTLHSHLVPEPCSVGPTLLCGVTTNVECSGLCRPQTTQAPLSTPPATQRLKPAAGGHQRARPRLLRILLSPRHCTARVAIYDGFLSACICLVTRLTERFYK